MVYKISDVAHLDLMAALEELKPAESDEVIVESKGSLDENILKLCNGLRGQGLDSYAESLEKKFITYKAAANTHLYRAHDEDGVDLINAAHPDGDVNMGDGERGDVETIVSHQKKMIDVVQKTPTGKLASYVEQCKIVLGQAAGISKKALSNGMRDAYVRLNANRNFINSIRSQPELKDNEQIHDLADALNTVQLWVNDLFTAATDAQQRKTELNPSRALMTVEDINGVLSQDQRYNAFASILTVTQNPSELFTKFSQLVNFIRSKTVAAVNAIENPEVKESLLKKMSAAGI